MVHISLYAACPMAGENLHDTAYRLLRYAAKQCGAADALQIELRPGGKPYCLNKADFYFNLSHTTGWAVCAAANCPVGVDIQKVRPVYPSVVKRLSCWEQTQLAHLPAESFFDIWTLKEAAAKCTGCCGPHGILYDSEVTLSPLSVGRENMQAALVPFPEPGIHLAVAAATENEICTHLYIE